MIKAKIHVHCTLMIRYTGKNTFEGHIILVFYVKVIFLNFYASRRSGLREGNTVSEDRREIPRLCSFIYGRHSTRGNINKRHNGREMGHDFTTVDERRNGS